MVTARPVLVVHHHPLVVEALDMTLSGLGFTVHAAVTYPKAMRLLEHLASGLAAVVAHGDMPGEPLDGALLRTVRFRHPGAAIVVISARPRCEIGELPERSVYLPEPFDRADLVAAIASACDPRTARSSPCVGADDARFPNAEEGMDGTWTFDRD